MQARYTWLKGIPGCEFFPPRSGGSWNWTFFQFLMLNISSIKELLHKPSEIQWNITGTLPGKLKRKISWSLSYKIITPWNNKNVTNCPGNQCKIPWFLMILWISESFTLYLLDRNSFNFELGFFTHFEYISGGIIRKSILCQVYHSARWCWCKKVQKNLLQTSGKNFFLDGLLWILHCYEHLWFITFAKICFQGVKVEKMAFL